MPELPEVEHLRRSLEPLLIGQAVAGFDIGRDDVVRDAHGDRRSRTPTRRRLIGATVTNLLRRGKQLAIITDRGPVICVHLGMSGQLLFIPRGARMARPDHVHCTWRLRNGVTSGRMAFRDPRRFGGVWLFASVQELLDKRWTQLGPDALDIRSSTLRAAIGSSHRSIKPALMDQASIAGIGNIYADEALHRAGIHPLATSSELTVAQWTRLASAIRKILREAVRCGGSTLRDYRDGRGRGGSYAALHRVYGRAGQPCLCCGRLLLAMRLAQRTTVFCPCCQHR